MTHISDVDECRRLARNVVTADFSNTQINSYQDKEYSYIATMTDKDDWAATDREYGILQLIETRLVAADIMQHYGETEEAIRIALMNRESAMAELDKIIDNMDTPIETTEIDVDIGRTTHKGWGLNTSLSPPNRMGNTSTNTESS